MRRLGIVLLVSGSALGAHAQQPLFEDQHRMLPVESAVHVAVAAGDLDGDGDPDLLVGRIDGDPELRRNDGSGAFEEVAGAVAGPGLPSHELALADVDGDGDLDAFVARLSLQNGLLVNDGSGVFADASANLPALVDATLAVELADLDGDGDADALVGNWGGELDRLLLNEGDGVFLEGTANLAGLPLWTNALAVGDVDADGDLDYVTGNGYLAFYQKSRLFLNSGAGVFADAQGAFPSVPAVRCAVDLGDVDGDGDLDYAGLPCVPELLVPGGLPTGLPELLLNDGAGVFSTPPSGSPDVDGTIGDMLFADLDDDGDEELIVGLIPLFFSPSKAQGRVFETEGEALVEVADAIAPGLVWAHDLVACDVDGDQDTDLVFACDGQDRLYLNDGSGGLVGDAARLPSAVSEGYDVAVGDLSGDGFPDLVFTSFMELFLGDGTGAFTGPTTVGTESPQPRWIDLGDVEGDGDLDLVVASWGVNALHLNDGGAGFTDASAQLPPNVEACFGVELGDLDGDGDLDAVFLQAQLAGDYLQLNDGAGSFGAHVSLEFETNSSSTDLALGDLDLDGALDLVILGANPTRLLLGDGAAGFAEDATGFPGLALDMRVVALADVDGDGDLDAFFDRSSGAAQLFANDGAAAFTDVTDARLGDVDYPTSSVAFGDVDLDGDPDVLLGADGPVAGFGDAYRNTVLLNDGAGAFTDAPWLLPDTWGRTGDVALADLDLDGDADAVVGNLERMSRVFVNRLRQLTRRGFPRIAKPLRFELDGTPGGGWVLAVATQELLLPLPPFGNLRLNPALAVVLGAGVLDAQGEGAFDLLVPADPTLVGQAYAWQAAVGTPLRFTNLERTTFTAF